jgi:hypothetical protein
MRKIAYALTGIALGVLIVACGGGDGGGNFGGSVVDTGGDSGGGDGGGGATQESFPDIRVLSNRPDLLSGGDALVEIVRPASGPQGLDGLTVDVGGRNVTSAFSLTSDGRILGVVTGLAVGDNTLHVGVANGTGSTLTLVNHPIGGPVFSGEQVQPWVCNTTSNPSLGAAIDAQCNAPTAYRYVYRTLTNSFQPYDPANPPAANVIAEATTYDGVKVPYIVRIERGTMNRGIHEIAVLFDPSKPWTPQQPQAHWNGKVLVLFGGGTSQKYYQTTPESVQNNEALAAGYAVASSGLLVHGNNANYVTVAETVMMLKEHIIEAYGPIRYTVGQGGSGGALLQHLTADGYPGLLDGLRPTQDWTDSLSGAYREFVDNAVLTHAFTNSTAGFTYANEDRALFSGFAPFGAGVGTTESGRVGDYNRPDDGTRCAADASYDPVNNPTGTRCTWQDFQSSIIGRRAEDGYTNTIYDNVGLQFGLTSLLRGALSVERFLDVNANAGGFDVNGVWQPQRSAISPEIAARLHRTGLITYGKYMGEVPELAIRGTNNNDYHYPFRTYVQRARLTAANGHADNHVFWVSPPSSQSTLAVMDRWLTAIAADTAPGTKAEKTVRNKPADLVSGCWISGTRYNDIEGCDVSYPLYREPRTTAGDTLAGYVMKCQLKPLAREDYPGVTFNAQQWATLQTIFPDGVCDFSKPGVGFAPNVPWLTYQDGPGGQPLPAVATAQPDK